VSGSRRPAISLRRVWEAHRAGRLAGSRRLEAEAEWCCGLRLRFDGATLRKSRCHSHGGKGKVACFLYRYPASASCRLVVQLIMIKLRITYCNLYRYLSVKTFVRHFTKLLCYLIFFLSYWTTLTSNLRFATESVSMFLFLSRFISSC